MKLTLASVGIAFLVLLSASSGDGENVCNTEACKTKAQNILKYMDPDVKPCDDFYQFTCGKLMKNEKPKGKGTNSTFHSIKKLVEVQMRDILEEPIDPEEHNAFKAAKKFYGLCMNDAEKKSPHTLARASGLLRSAGWPVLGGWSGDDWTLHGHERRLRTTAMAGGALVDVRLSPGPQHTGKAQVVVDQPSWVRKWHRKWEMQEDFVDELDLPLIREYENYMVDLAVMFGADRQTARTQLRDSLLFELALEKILSETIYRHRPYEMMTLSELMSRHGWIDWTELLDTVVDITSIGDDELIKVFEPEYLDRLFELISEHPNRAIANFMGWRAAEPLSLMLTPEMNARRTQFEKTKGVKNEEPWQICSTLVLISPLGLAANSMYVKKYMPNEQRELVRELASNLRDQMSEIINSEDWIEEKTKEKALLKLCKMRQNIGCPEELTMDSKIDKYYEKLHFSQLTDFLEAQIIIDKWNMNYGFPQRRKNEWVTYGAFSTMVNAFYDPHANVLQLPAAFMQMPIFSDSLPKYTYYSAAGLVSGHEITHGFDNGGIVLDEEGNYNTWMDASSQMNFDWKSRCMLNEYSKYVEKCNATAKVDDPFIYLAGNGSLQEIIADNGGLKLAYLAYQKISDQLEVPEPLLPGLEHFTRDQMFFVSLGSMWCWLQDPEELPSEPADIHPPSEFRVNGVLQNFPEFSEAFGCKAGSNMNPKTKCSVW